jgi:hypothetical protein
MRQRADGGEVEDAMRIARDRLGTGGRPQQIGGYNFHPEFASDRDALIRAMYAEAGNQSPEGMAKVGYNIRNRADADYGGYGHDIQKQILAQGKSGRGGQYSSFLANRPETNIAGRNAMKLDPESAQYKKIGDVADRVLGRVEQDPTMGASHYYAPQGMPGHRAPKWANDPGMKFLGQEGAHKFYQQAGFNPEQSATPMKLGDTAMLQGAKPSEQAMRVASLGTMGDTQMRLPDAMQASAPVQVAKAELPAMHVGTRAPEPAPMRVAQAAPVAQARTPISATEPTTTPQHAATPEASPRNIAASDTGPGTSAHEFVQSQGIGVPEQPMPDVQAPMEMAPVEPPDMTAGLENIFSSFADGGSVNDVLRLASGGGAWTRKEGKNPKGGLNAKGRASLKAQGHDIKPPQPEGGPRRDSFCSRMLGMKKKLTSKETANDPNSRINKSLRAWNCADGGEVWDKPRPKKLGKSKGLTDAQQASAKASAKAAGRPYPNLVDNMKAARKD